MKFSVIKKKVCEEFEITVEEFDGPNRFRNLVLARHRAWWLGHKEGYSYCDLGRWSNKDHSTTVYGVAMEEFRQTGKVDRYIEGRVARYVLNKHNQPPQGSKLEKPVKIETPKKLPVKARPKLIKPMYRMA
jgi:hypothetical protein